MQIADYDDVYQLWTNTTGMGLRSLDDSRAGISRFIERNPNTCFIAQTHDKLIGVILCGNDGRRGYIYHVAVSPTYRKRGIGKSLVDVALNALKNEHITKVALVVFRSNDLGNEFWSSIGFETRDDLIYRNISINQSNV